MADYLFDQAKTQVELQNFFDTYKASLTSFGNFVNQTFEAFAFAKVIEWYQDRGYSTKIINPKVNGVEVFRLKFSTRGTPNKFSYAVMTLGVETVQIRHQLRVSTSTNSDRLKYSANICCDVVVLNNEDLQYFSSETPIPSNWLISFGEMKHMSAFAELVASFLGLVHELAPKRLRKIRKRGLVTKHLPPFLYVSGYMNPTAKGLFETIKRRKYDVDIYSFENPL
jgi:hypothetical protein